MSNETRANKILNFIGKKAEMPEEDVKVEGTKTEEAQDETKDEQAVEDAQDEAQMAPGEKIYVVVGPYKGNIGEIKSVGDKLYSVQLEGWNTMIELRDGDFIKRAEVTM